MAAKALIYRHSSDLWTIRNAPRRIAFFRVILQSYHLPSGTYHLAIFTFDGQRATLNVVGSDGSTGTRYHICTTLCRQRRPLIGIGKRASNEFPNCSPLILIPCLLAPRNRVVIISRF